MLPDRRPPLPIPAAPAEALRERQRAFAAAILDPALPPPLGLVGPDGRPSARRFAVYRNNVVAGLIETLKCAYPAILRLVGDEFFAAMARIFVSQHPPVSPIMLDYGDGFADFVAGFPPAADLVYLADVARLERAWVEAYHAPERAPAAADGIAAIDPASLPQLRFELHPSLRLVRSPHPVVTIWQMSVDGDGGDIDPDAREDALVLRPDAEVTVRRLPAGAAVFIAALAAGGTVVEATRRALTDATAFNLAGTLAGLIGAGAVTGWALADPLSNLSSGRTA